MNPPPEEIFGTDMTLRRWDSAWASVLAQAVQTSLPQLQAYMPWAGDDYGLTQAGEFLQRAADQWSEGTEFGYAIVTPDGRIVGSASLMTRMGPGVLEIGYWVRTADTGRGLATEAVRSLTRVAAGMEGVSTVAIRHDAANAASARVAEKAGFTEVQRRPSTLTPLARGDSGEEVVWEMSVPGRERADQTEDRNARTRSMSSPEASGS